MNGYASRPREAFLTNVYRDAVAFPSNGCEIVHIEILSGRLICLRLVANRQKGGGNVEINK